MHIKQSTAYTFRLGPFLDETDGKTAETALTITQADIRISKAGAAFAQKNDATAATHDENGYYSIVMNTTDTNTVGELLVAVHESGALPVFKTFQVLEEAIYDALYGASAAGFDTNGRVDVAKIEGSDATDQINAACDAAIETYGLDHLVSASVAGADVADDSIIAQLVSSSATADWDTFDNATDSLQSIRDLDGSSYTAIPWNAAWDTEVESEVNDALTAYDPPTKTEMDALWTSVQTESYAADGAAATPAQLLYMIWCAVNEFSISGTTITGKEVNGTDTAMTWTLDDATNPTSRTRAS